MRTTVEADLAPRRSLQPPHSITSRSRMNRPVAFSRWTVLEETRKYRIIITRQIQRTLHADGLRTPVMDTRACESFQSRPTAPSLSAWQGRERCWSRPIFGYARLFFFSFFSICSFPAVDVLTCANVYRAFCCSLRLKFRQNTHQLHVTAADSFDTYLLLISEWIFAHRVKIKTHIFC